LLLSDVDVSRCDVLSGGKACIVLRIMPTATPSWVSLAVMASDALCDGDCGDRGTSDPRLPLPNDPTAPSSKCTLRLPREHDCELASADVEKDGGCAACCATESDG
jgi:hypothetical protein